MKENQPPLTFVLSDDELQRVETGQQTEIHRPLTSFWWKKVFTSREPIGFPNLMEGSYNGRNTHAVIRRGPTSTTRVLRWRLGHTGVAYQEGKPFIYVQLHPNGKDVLCQ